MTKPTLVQATDHDRELFSMASLDERLPFIFPRSSFRIDVFSGECTGCGRKLSGPNLRGMIRLDFENVATLDAIGNCVDCGFFSRFRYRLHDDGAITGLRDGRWCRWEPTRTGKKLRDKQTDAGADEVQMRPQKGLTQVSAWLVGFLATLLWPFYLASALIGYLVQRLLRRWR